MTSLLKRLARRSLTLGIAALGTSTMLLIGALQSTPVQAASHVSRVSLAQAANGYTVKATYNMDVVIRFDGNEHIAYVWGSNNLLFNPRFVTGGKLLVLQSTARPINMAVLPELGRPAGTLTVVLESGDSVVLNLLYTPQAQSQIVEIYRFGGNSTDQARLPDILSEVQQAQAQQSANSQMRINSMGSRVTQDGFISPLSGAQPSQSAVGAVRQQSAQSGTARTGYSIVDWALAAPGVWQSGPDALAYRAFIQFLQQGRADGAEFEPTLAMAQRMTGVSDSNLVWLVRQLATVEVQAVSSPPPTTLSKSSTSNNPPPSTSDSPAPPISVIPPGATSTIGPLAPQIPLPSTPISVAPFTIPPSLVLTIPSEVSSPTTQPWPLSSTQPLALVPPSASTTTVTSSSQKVEQSTSDKTLMLPALPAAAVDPQTQLPVTLHVALHPFAESETVLPLRFAPRPVPDTQDSPGSPITPGNQGGVVNQVLPVEGFPVFKEAKLPLLVNQFKVVQTMTQPVSPSSAEGQR
jgi:hypothetical protein